MEKVGDVMSFIATKIKIGQDFTEGLYTVTFYTKQKPLDLEKLQSENNIDVEAKKHREARSLNANSYCWVLCDKIAKELCKDGTVVTKEKIYQDSILQIGTFEPMIVQEKAFENFKRIWEKQGLGFLIQEVSRKDKCVKVHCYYGSSTYDTKEMSLLIDLLVGLATSLEIEIKPQAEIDSLLKEWDKK